MSNAVTVNLLAAIDDDGVEHWEQHTVALGPLADDLLADGLIFHSLGQDGELWVEDEDGKGEIWQARVEGCGCNNSMWGDLPGGFEFCGSK